MALGLAFFIPSSPSAAFVSKSSCYVFKQLHSLHGNSSLLI